MALIILGKSGDDKGSQLEQLTKTILKHQGYTNVVTNVQVGGGSELDVTADRKNITGIKEIHTPVLCECKAHQSQITLPDWLKFIGKLTIARKKNERTIGLMIALNGANGSVIGSYNNDFSDDESVQLIANDDLLELIRQIFNLPTIDTVKGILNNNPGIEVEDIDWVYYKKKVYWLISLGGQNYTFCNAEGKLSERKDVKELLPMLKGVTRFDEGGYVDVFKTFELQRRLVLLKVRIITELVNGRPANKRTIDAIAKELGAGIIDLPTLVANDPFMEYDGAKKMLTLKKDEEIDFCNFYRSILSVMTPIELIMSDYYQSHINDDLLERIWEIQSTFRVEECDKNGCLTILRLSPSSLLYVLSPDVLFQGFKSTQNDEQMRILYQSHFKSMLFQRFQSDYQNQGLSELFLSNGASKATIQMQLNIGEGENSFVLESRQNFLWMKQSDSNQPPVFIVAKD